CRITSASPIIAACASASPARNGRKVRRSVRRTGASPIGKLFLAEGKAAEALVEARDLAARVEQLLVAAGPGRMRLGIDVQLQRVAFLAPGRTGLEGRAVGHLDLDHMVIGMGVDLHLIDLS